MKGRKAKPRGALVTRPFLCFPDHPDVKCLAMSHPPHPDELNLLKKINPEITLTAGAVLPGAGSWC